MEAIIKSLQKALGNLNKLINNRVDNADYCGLQEDCGVCEECENCEEFNLNRDKTEDLEVCASEIDSIIDDLKALNL